MRLESRGVQDTYTVDALDGLVKSTCLGDILDDGKGQLISVLGVALLHLLGRLVAADGGADIVALMEEGIEDVSGNEAGTSSDEDGLPTAGTADDLLDLVDDGSHYEYEGAMYEFRK